MQILTPIVRFIRELRGAPTVRTDRARFPEDLRGALGRAFPSTPPSDIDLFVEWVRPAGR